jgi:hypothetical protein
MNAKVADRPVAGQTVRVDYVNRLGAAEVMETKLVGFGGRTHRLLELTTRRARPRGKTCPEISETILSFDPIEVAVVATTKKHVEATLGDDDLPVDKKCRAPDGATREVYRWHEDRFVLAPPEPEPVDGGAHD